MTDTRNPSLSLGEMLRDRRVTAGMSLRELSRRVEIAPSYINDIEHNRRTPSEAVLDKLAEHLDLGRDELLHLAGRLGESTELYLKAQPVAGALLRTMSSRNLGEADLQKLLRQAERMRGAEPHDDGSR